MVIKLFLYKLRNIITTIYLGLRPYHASPVFSGHGIVASARHIVFIISYLYYGHLTVFIICMLGCRDVLPPVG